MYNEIQNMHILKTEVLNYAAWNKKEKLNFMENSTDSCVNGDGGVEVQGMDIIEIAAYILELVPDYKFYIRHYYSNMCETVLYAEI